MWFGVSEAKPNTVVVQCGAVLMHVVLICTIFLNYVISYSFIMLFLVVRGKFLLMMRFFELLTVESECPNRLVALLCLGTPTISRRLRYFFCVCC
jgi:hypothetical protein